MCFLYTRNVRLLHNSSAKLYIFSCAQSWPIVLTACQSYVSCLQCSHQHTALSRTFFEQKITTIENQQCVQEPVLCSMTFREYLWAFFPHWISVFWSQLPNTNSAKVYFMYNGVLCAKMRLLEDECGTLQRSCCLGNAVTGTGSKQTALTTLHIHRPRSLPYIVTELEDSQGKIK